MGSFQDNAGRQWFITITVDTLKRVRGLLDLDLLQITRGDGQLVERLITDPVLLCDVIYVVCKPEADAKGVSDEDFGRSMAGDAIEQATTALLGALVSFCPSPKDRANLQRLMNTAFAVMDKARDLVTQKLAAGELEREVERMLTETIEATPLTPGNSSGNVPASSG